jgi:hypothetical protein
MTGSTITQKAGKGIVRIETDRDNAMALLALLAYCDSDGTISISSSSLLAGPIVIIDIHGRVKHTPWHMKKNKHGR